MLKRLPCSSTAKGHQPQTVQAVDSKQPGAALFMDHPRPSTLKMTQCLKNPLSLGLSEQAVTWLNYLWNYHWNPVSRWMSVSLSQELQAYLRDQS